MSLSKIQNNSFVRVVISFLLAVSITSISYAQELNSLSRYNEVLNSFPKSFQENGKPKASVGTILYTRTIKNQIFILLGQEGTNKKSAGTYCELGGSMELKSNGSAESFLEGCIRECKEESAQVYTLDKEYILKNSYVYYNVTPQDREELYIFIESPKYYSADDLLQAVQQQVQSEYREKVKFKWVRVKDLLNCKSQKCQLRDIEGTESEILLRDYFYNTIQNPKVKKILKSL